MEVEEELSSLDVDDSDESDDEESSSEEDSDEESEEEESEDDDEESTLMGLLRFLAGTASDNFAFTGRYDDERIAERLHC